MPQWFVIVSQYPDFHNGPTVPFLLGALQTPIGAKFADENAARASLRSLLETIRDEAGKEYGVRFYACPTIKEYVLIEDQLVSSLYWGPIDGCTMPDIDCLADALWNRYGEPITSGTYSIDDRVWHEFTADEVAKIGKLLSD